jgi:hypothetical protein
VILISNLVLNISDNVSAVPSTELYGADKTTYINIGSGIIFKLDWETPVLTDDDIDRYSLVIKRYDPTLNVYYDIFDKNIGLVNEFFVDSFMLPIAPEQYMLSIYLVAYSKHGSVVISDVITPYIIKGSGTYVKVKEDNYNVAIMKRALGFVNTPQAMSATRAAQSVLTDINGLVLTDSAGNILSPKPTAALLDRLGQQFEDRMGRALFASATKLLENTSNWSIVQKGYIKDAAGHWRTNDIAYEVLQVLNDQTGQYEVLVDSNNNPIYIL